MTNARQLRQCADAVTLELNQGPFDPPLAAKRVNRPRFELAELSQLVVSVMPVARVTELASRQEDQITLRIDVGLQQRFATGDLDNVDSDPLLDVGEEICEHFARRVLVGADGFSPYTCNKTVYGDEDSPFYDPDHAQAFETFTGVASLYFVTFREVDNS